MFLFFDNENRRDCFNLSITDDTRAENTEQLTIQLDTLPDTPLPSGVLLNPNVATVEILANDGMNVQTFLTQVM